MPLNACKIGGPCVVGQHCKNISPSVFCSQFIYFYLFSYMAFFCLLKNVHVQVVHVQVALDFLVVLASSVTV